MGGIVWSLVGWVAKKAEPYASHFAKWAYKRAKRRGETWQEAALRRSAESQAAIAKQRLTELREWWLNTPQDARVRVHGMLGTVPWHDLTITERMKLLS